MSVTPAQLTSLVHDTVPVLAAMDVRILDAVPGRAVVELPAESNRNHFGAAYAGSLYAAAEVLGGVIARVTFDLDGDLAGFVPLLKSSEIHYLRPAFGDVRAEARLPEADLRRVPQEAVARGKADFTLTADVVDADGAVVAAYQGTYQLRRL